MPLNLRQPFRTPGAQTRNGASPDRESTRFLRVSAASTRVLLVALVYGSDPAPLRCERFATSGPKEAWQLWIRCAPTGAALWGIAWHHRVTGEGDCGWGLIGWSLVYPTCESVPAAPKRQAEGGMAALRVSGVAIDYCVADTVSPIRWFGFRTPRIAIRVPWIPAMHTWAHQAAH